MLRTVFEGNPSSIVIVRNERLTCAVSDKGHSMRANSSCRKVITRNRFFLIAVYLLIDDEVSEFCPRAVVAVGSLINTYANSGCCQFYGRARHILPFLSIAAGASKELAAATFKLQ